MKTQIQVVFYSMYGHVYQLAEAVAAGAREVEGCEVRLLQVPELMSDGSASSRVPPASTGSR